MWSIRRPGRLGDEVSAALAAVVAAHTAENGSVRAVDPFMPEIERGLHAAWFVTHHRAALDGCGG